MLTERLPILLTRTPNAATFLIGLYDFTSRCTMDWRGMCAVSVLTMITAIIFVIPTQRNMARGLTFRVIEG
ncbi:MAG: hypothetical protein JNL42_01120 [Anaerolineae bacterium]|nr:hypothetical protein [Anaerolineae bacterium]